MDERTKLFKYDRDRLKPFVERLEAMHQMLREDSDEELESLLEACGRATATNCYWLTYDAARWVERRIKSELLERRIAREKAARSASSAAGEPK